MFNMPHASYPDDWPTSSAIPQLIKAQNICDIQLITTRSGLENDL